MAVLLTTMRFEGEGAESGSGNVTPPAYWL